MTLRQKNAGNGVWRIASPMSKTFFKSGHDNCVSCNVCIGYKLLHKWKAGTAKAVIFTFCQLEIEAVRIKFTCMLGLGWGQIVAERHRKRAKLSSSIRRSGVSSDANEDRRLHRLDVLFGWLEYTKYTCKYFCFGKWNTDDYAYHGHVRWQLSINGLPIPFQEGHF